MKVVKEWIYPLKMVKEWIYPLNMVIFYSCVSLPEGNRLTQFVYIYIYIYN